MLPSSTPARQATHSPFSHDLNLDLAAGERLDFDLDDAVVSLHGTDSGVAVLSSHGNAVVVRPQPDGRFIVTGASAHHRPSEPLTKEDAIALAVRRLER